MVGLATLLHADHVRNILGQTVTRLAPGPAGEVVMAAFRHGQRAVGGGALTALVFGLVAALLSAATAMGQVERGANRIYGVERDRPTLRKYAVGFLLACSPRRHQPAASWLASGSAVSVLLGSAFTALLSLYLEASGTFGQTYGPLAGLIGVLVWALLMSLAVFLGLAFAAQLEAIRAGVRKPITGEQTNPPGARQQPVRGRRWRGLLGAGR